MKIYAPNKAYTGVSASVAFCNGIGETDNPNLINWFKEHGYIVEEVSEEPKIPAGPNEPETPTDPETPKKGKAATKKAGE